MFDKKNDDDMGIFIFVLYFSRKVFTQLYCENSPTRFKYVKMAKKKNKRINRTNIEVTPTVKVVISFT